jgi:hypothetical protein
VLTTGASAPVFALAALAETRTIGLLLAFEQASMTAVEVSSGAMTVTHVERPAQDLPRQRITPGPEIRKDSTRNVLK